MIEAVILYILNKYDATIYKIGKTVNELFFAYLKSSTGTLNPALKRLFDLGCVEYQEKMSDGGMLSKTYSITKEGKRYLSHLLITFEPKNPYYIINDAKIALFCSDVLEGKDIEEFQNNFKNVVELYKIKLEKGLKNDYLGLNDIQKATVQLMFDEIEGLLRLL